MLSPSAYCLRAVTRRVARATHDRDFLHYRPCCRFSRLRDYFCCRRRHAMPCRRFIFFHIIIYYADCRHAFRRLPLADAWLSYAAISFRHCRHHDIFDFHYYGFRRQILITLALLLLFMFSLFHWLAFFRHLLILPLLIYLRLPPRRYYATIICLDMPAFAFISPAYYAAMPG
jgi:hypothetical protein